MRIRDDDFAREFQCCNRLFTANRREFIKEDLETVTSFEVVKENLDRYPRTDKNRGSPQNLGIAVHDQL